MRDWVWVLLGGDKFEASIRELLLGLLLCLALIGSSYYRLTHWLPAVPVGVVATPTIIAVGIAVAGRFRHQVPRIGGRTGAVLYIGGLTLFGYFDIPERVAATLGVSDIALNGFVLGALGYCVLVLAIRIGLSLRQSGSLRRTTSRPR